MIRHGFKKWIHRGIEVPLEGIGLILVFLVLRGLPLPWATQLGSWVGRHLGPLFPHHQRAERNLSFIYPEKETSFYQKITEGMWDNLGRLIAEYAHLDHIDKKYIHVQGSDILEALKADGKPAILFGAHLAHWELITLTALSQDLPVSQVYRQANNPIGNWLIRRLQKFRTDDLIPKGPQAGKLIFGSLRRGNHLIMLMDQKLNTGISVPFMGHPAMTSPAAARFALHFSCPLVPVQVIRRGRKTLFDVIYHPPLEFPHSGNQEEDIRLLTEKMNQILGEWVHQHPEQWLWLHRRWGKI